MVAANVMAEINEEDQKIEVYFSYNVDDLSSIKSVAGARFVSRDRAKDGNPHWTVPLELECAKRLIAAFGKRLRVGPKLRSWGKEKNTIQKTLLARAAAEDATLHRLPAVLPELAETLYPYQRAGVAFMAEALNPLIADQPGLGKTMQTIGSLFEKGTDIGAHLVMAPVSSLESVWKYELERWQPYPVLLAMGSKGEKTAVMEMALELHAEKLPFWLVTNPHTIMAKNETDEKTGKKVMVPKHPQLFQIEWQTAILDEIHRAGFRDLNSQMATGIMALHCEHRVALSGTPIGGKPINLWPILKWLNPDDFASKWRWADQWLYVTDTGWGKDIGDIRKGMEEDFYSYHAPYMLRRTKLQVLPELPPKQRQDVWVELDGKQKKQYKEFALRAETIIEELGESISATSILAEYTRLKQFADAYCTVERDEGEKFHVIPTEHSVKLAAVEEILEQRGIFDGNSDEQVVIFSQFSKMVDMVHNWLVNKKRVDAMKLTGATTKKGERAELQRAFQAKEYPVIVMSTTAGGVAITLDAADTVIFLDETWVPDDQEQAEDRIHRASRIHQVTAYYIRSRDTLEEYIMRRVGQKENINIKILDLHREGFRADKG